MRLGEILLKRELVNPAEISEALDRQKIKGGRLGANLIALGYLTEEQLSSVIHGAPAASNGVSATGIPPRSLLSLLLKFMSVEGCETVLDLANRIKLPRLVVQQLFDEHRAGRADHGRILYAIAMFSCWWRQQVETAPTAAASAPLRGGRVEVIGQP